MKTIVQVKHLMNQTLKSLVNGENALLPSILKSQVLPQQIQIIELGQGKSISLQNVIWCITLLKLKARRGMQHGLAREAVTKKKQKHIKRAAMLFLYDLHQKKRHWKEISFDVIEVYLHEDFKSSIHICRSAFSEVSYVCKTIWSHLTWHRWMHYYSRGRYIPRFTCI